MTALFCLFEFCNLSTHLILRNLRPPGTKERRIPHGCGFDLVSCANYLWESCAWTTFVLQVQVLGGFVFLAASNYIMSNWALKKHRRYKKEFPDYPKGRKAMFPFLLLVC